jgi:hypothetical protein
MLCSAAYYKTLVKLLPGRRAQIAAEMLVQVETVADRCAVTNGDRHRAPLDRGMHHSAREDVACHSSGSSSSSSARGTRRVWTLRQWSSVNLIAVDTENGERAQAVADYLEARQQCGELH